MEGLLSCIFTLQKWHIPKISFKGLPEAGEKQCMEKKERKSERKKEEQKSVLKMASYA